MKGLDGIQGPIYVGTGCVFRRQALYGYDAPKTKKPPSRTCNCWPKWCCCSWCCGGKKKKKTTKSKQEKKKKFFRRGDNVAPVFALEGIEEGVEGSLLISLQRAIHAVVPVSRDCFYSYLFSYYLVDKSDMLLTSWKRYAYLDALNDFLAFLVL